MDALWMEELAPPMTVEERLAWALEYHGYGWSLLPLGSGTKEPHAGLLPRNAWGKASWKELAVRRASIPEIRYWFEVDPECDLGVLTGLASGGLVVLDYDRTAPPQPLTPMVWSRRGLHVYLRCLQAVRSRKIPGGDVKAEGGYAVLPFSLHPSGWRYRWVGLLSPRDTELADLPRALVEIPPRAGRRAGGNPGDCSSETGQGEACGVARNNVSCSGAFRGVQEGKAGGLDALACIPEVAVAVLQHLGCEVDRLEQNILCPVPGHEEERPSAALWQAEGRPIRLHCFHDDAWWCLPDLYAAITTRKARPLRKGERMIWWVRALHEAGLVTAAEVPAASLPTYAPESVWKLYEGFCYLLSLRRLYDADQAGTPFSWSFAADWCGIGSYTTVGRAVSWLLTNGYLRVIEKGQSGPAGARRASLFTLGTPRLR